MRSATANEPYGEVAQVAFFDGGMLLGIDACAPYNLAAPVIWTPLTNAVSQVQDQFVVAVSLDTAARFFRLRAP